MISDAKRYCESLTVICRKKSRSAAWPTPTCHFQPYRLPLSLRKQHALATSFIYCATGPLPLPPAGVVSIGPQPRVGAGGSGNGMRARGAAEARALAAATHQLPTPASGPPNRPQPPRERRTEPSPGRSTSGGNAAARSRHRAAQAATAADDSPEIAADGTGDGLTRQRRLSGWNRAPRPVCGLSARPRHRSASGTRTGGA